MGAKLRSKNKVMKRPIEPDSKMGDVLKCYLKEIAGTKPVSAAEERSLAFRIRQGDMEARAKLIESNLLFVVTVARKYIHRGIPLEDLISAGNMGLITAAERFDGTKEIKFISYAVWWIRQSILQMLENEGRAVRLPSNQIALLNRISHCISDLQQKSFSDPVEEDIAEELGVSEAQVADILVKGKNALSLETEIAEDSRLLDAIPDESSPVVDEAVLEEALREDIEAVLNTLEEREREIIKLYFGLDSESITLEEIGQQYGLTRERVRQIKEKTLRKLRHPGRARKLRAYAKEN